MSHLEKLPANLLERLIWDGHVVVVVTCQVKLEKEKVRVQEKDARSTDRKCLAETLIKQNKTNKVQQPGSHLQQHNRLPNCTFTLDAVSTSDRRYRPVGAERWTKPRPLFMAIATAIKINYGSSRDSVVDIVFRPLDKFQCEGELDQPEPPSRVAAKLYLVHESMGW